MPLMRICLQWICSTGLDLCTKFSHRTGTASLFLFQKWTVASDFHVRDDRLGLGDKGHPLVQEAPVGLIREGK